MELLRRLVGADVELDAIAVAPSFAYLTRTAAWTQVFAESLDEAKGMLVLGQ